MKVVFDTNIYISWIRDRRFAELLLDVRTQKYMSSFVLMELWAGAKTKNAGRIVEQLQKSYIKADRIIEPARLFTTNISDFKLIASKLSGLKLVYVTI